MIDNCLENILKDNECKFILTIDCEGHNFDKNLENNVRNLTRLLRLTSDNNIYTILFITPYFADMLYKLGLTQEIKSNYKVIFGLHIHPNNFPEEIQRVCSFLRAEEDEIAAYTLVEQTLVLKEAINYLKKREIFPLQIYRGGYFSFNDHTAKALTEVSDIRWESHNVYRNQYNITKNILESLPVFASDQDLEFRLEYFSKEKLVEMTREALKLKRRIVGITHSYLLDDNDTHYKRDNIEDSVFSRLEAIINEIASVKIR
jgi:hypothetical protein